MSIETFKKQLVDTFGPSTSSLNEEELGKLKNLSEIYNAPVDELYLQWESFNVAEVQEDLDLNMENLARFHEFLQNKLSQKSTPLSGKTRDIHSNRKPLMRKPINAANPSTPNIKKRKLDQSSPDTRTPIESSPGDFATANNTFVSPAPAIVIAAKPSHSLLETLNPTVDEIEGDLGEAEEKRFRLTTNFDGSKYKFRTMQMKLLEGADVLDDQIDTMMGIYQDANKSSDTQFGNPCLSSQFEILCCGRIVPDSPLYDKENVALNSTSLYLETSRVQGIGQRVPLDLSKLSSYSFFSGQIVILKGRNPSGRTFIVDEVLGLPQLGVPLSSSDEIKEIQELQGNQGLKVLVASGPFSNSQTLNYDRLNNLVELINTKIFPNVVILNGPFLDITNKSVEEGEFDIANDKQQPRNLDEVFKFIITPILKKIDQRIQVVLYPSVKDTCIKHCSYPQDIFDRKKFGLPKNIKVFPNPSSFSINEVLIGNSNLDVFRDLRDVTKDNETSSVLNNRFERIVSHLIDQRRYYPLFPGAIKSQPGSADMTKLLGGASGEYLTQTGIGGSCLEVPYLGLTEIGDVLPDILVLPSELKYFAKLIKGVLVINPGLFIRPNRDSSKQEGSYAVVHIQPSESSNLEAAEDNSGMFFHSIYNRSRVDIFSS